MFIEWCRLQLIEIKLNDQTTVIAEGGNIKVNGVTVEVGQAKGWSSPESGERSHASTSARLLLLRPSCNDSSTCESLVRQNPDKYNPNRNSSRIPPIN